MAGTSQNTLVLNRTPSLPLVSIPQPHGRRGRNSFCSHLAREGTEAHRGSCQLLRSWSVSWPGSDLAPHISLLRYGGGLKIMK